MKEIYEEELVEFLGMLKSSDAKHFLKIHHDYNMSAKGGGLIGHFYVELYDAITNTSTLRGQNPHHDARVDAMNVGEIKNELKRISDTKKYMDEMDDIILTTKVIPLNIEQYMKAMRFIMEYTCEVYIAGVNDCASYVQAVYNAAKLPRHFTDVYSSEELSELHGIAAFSVAQRFGSKDQNIIVGGFSEEEVARLYNVEVGRVIDATETLAVATPSLRPSKQYVILNETIWTQVSALEALGLTEDNPAPEKASHEWLTDIIQDSLKIFGGQSENNEQATRREVQESISFGLELQRQAVGMFGIDAAGEALHRTHDTTDSNRPTNRDIDELASMFAGMAGGVFEEAEAMRQSGQGFCMPFADPSATALNPSQMRQMIGIVGTMGSPNFNEE